MADRGSVYRGGNRYILAGALVPDSLKGWGMFGFFRRRKKAEAEAEADKGVPNPYSADPPKIYSDFNDEGFYVGAMTGVPLSPTHGYSTGAMLGAALHSEASSSSASEPGSSSGSSDSGGGTDGGDGGGGSGW